MQRTTTRIGLIFVILLLATFVPGAPARAQGEGFLTFEPGSDGMPINLPGIAFSTANDEPWQYGDVTTRRYNAPHPDSCAERPGSAARPVCEYAVSGAVFAWPGQLGREATLRFTQGGATYVEISFATGGALQVIATTDRGQVLDADAVAANTGTGRLDRVRLEAEAGQFITRVTIRGAPNFWLLDDLATDAPGVPDQRPPDSARPAHVITTLSVEPNTTIRPGDLLTLTFIVANRGPGRADDAVITLPLDDLPVRVVDAAFERPGVWVSRSDATMIQIRTGSLGPRGDAFQLTLRLRVNDDAARDRIVQMRAHVHWSDQRSGGRSLSNRLNITIADQSGVSAQPTLNVAAEATPLRTLAAAIFIPEEPVTFWYTTAAGVSVELGQVIADAEGNAALSINRETLPPGPLTLVAYGNWSALTAVALLE